jgi:4-diphosphocytidyl-2-C-methyl-D-erythritol kinase
MATEPIACRAHAKLTLSLKMTGIRSDGFHLIDAEMMSLDLHDVLVFDPERIGLAVTGKFSDGVPTDGSNLVARALDLTGSSAYVTIDKRIPHGGGLGGGSTDAATALAWAGWETDVIGLARAAELGADIAFCLVGGRARVTGIGEILHPLPHSDRTITLIIPPLRVSTPAAYRASRGSTAIAQWRDRIGDRCGHTPTLAGSGATWFVEGEHHNALADLVDEGAHVALAHAVPSDVAANRAN